MRGRTSPEITMPTRYEVVSDDEMEYLNGGSIVWSGTLTSAECGSLYTEWVGTCADTIYDAVVDLIGSFVGGYVARITGLGKLASETASTAVSVLINTFGTYNRAKNAYLTGSQRSGLRVLSYSTGDMAYTYL